MERNQPQEVDHAATQAGTTPDVGLLNNMPKELRDRPQWLLAGPNGKGELKVPITIDDNGQLAPGSSTDRKTWLTFPFAVAHAQDHGYGVGYVLAADDPYTCIDLDVKPDTPAEHIERQGRVFHQCASYTELSQSGKGAHIWCLGNIGKGRKRDGVEVYSQERFIACTGRVVHDAPIVDRQEMLDNMMTLMLVAEAGLPEGYQLAADADETRSDHDVREGMRRLMGEEKFDAVCRGDYVAVSALAGKEGLTASELDAMFAECSMFCGASNEQAGRLLLETDLGQRDGRKLELRGDRLLRRVLRFARQQWAIRRAMEEHGAQVAAALAPPQPQPAAQAPAGAVQTAAPVPAPLPRQFAAPQGVDPLHPPGMLGRMVDELDKRQILPLRVTAVMSATSWLAGVCGLAYMTPPMPGSTSTGLNAYEILVAQSAVGKENIVRNLGLMQEAARDEVPSASAFVDQISYASAPGLLKALVKQTSLLNVKDEWGDLLRRMADPKDAVAQALKGLLNTLYMKSSPSALALGTVQSEAQHTC
jgi:hypothetical protein